MGEEQFQRLVPVPRTGKAPPLTGDLAGATLIRTPAMRIAGNTAFHQAITRVPGVNDRPVAVGGVESWDDALRSRVRSGAVRQIGYGWHSPPDLDAPGVPVVPIFPDNEPDHMGRVAYVRLVGLLTAREREADAFADTVARNVAVLKAAAAQPTRSSPRGSAAATRRRSGSSPD